MTVGRTIYLDFGANDGGTIAAHLGSMPVDLSWAFEPNPTLAQHLRQRFAGQPVTIVEQAAWDRAGTMPLYLGHALSSTLLTGKVALPDYPEYAIDYSRAVEVATLDTAQWLRDNLEPDDHVTVKMDIEGAEYIVLPQLLKGGEIALIDELRCEFHPERFPAHQSLHDDLVLELAARTRLVHWV